MCERRAGHSASRVADLPDSTIFKRADGSRTFFDFFHVVPEMVLSTDADDRCEYSAPTRWKRRLGRISVASLAAGL